MSQFSSHAATHLRSTIIFWVFNSLTLVGDTCFSRVSLSSNIYKYKYKYIYDLPADEEEDTAGDSSNLSGTSPCFLCQTLVDAPDNA